MRQETQDRRWAAMIERWRGDPGFRSRMWAAPKAGLRESEIDLPEGVEDVRLAMDTADTVHMVLPPDPNSALPEAVLRGVVGGTSCWGTDGWQGWIDGYYHIFDSRELDAGGMYSSCR